MKAIIPAAGLGTRFLPATKAVPKELLPVLAKPTIQYVVEESLASEADEVIVITNQRKQDIAAHFSPDPELEHTLEAAGKFDKAAELHAIGAMPVSFVQQPEPLGLGHAVHCAAQKVLEAPVPEPFFVLLGDTLVPEKGVLPRMLEVSRAHGNASVIAVFEVPMDQVSRFGIIGGTALSKDVWRVSALVEKPSQDEAPSQLAIFGRYLLAPRVMEILGRTAPGVGGEIQLTDALIVLLEKEEIYALVMDPQMGYDVGTVESWLETNMLLAQGY